MRVFVTGSRSALAELMQMRIAEDEHSVIDSPTLEHMAVHNSGRVSMLWQHK